MDLIKYIIEYDGASLLINKEYVVTSFPLCIEWFAGNDLILEPSDFQKIKITDGVYILRKGTFKKGKTEIPAHLFLESVRRADYDRARRYLTFEISDKQLREYFGEFEILVNNYLGREDVFSILPKGAEAAKNFLFEVEGGRIRNISDY